MATGTGSCRPAPVDQSPDDLDEDNLKVVFKALHSVAEKYVFLGIEMNVKMNEIEKIQKRCSDPDECLLKVLSVRLKQIPSLTWRDIDTALRSGPVGEPQLADRIRRQYGHLYRPDLSFEASLNQEQGRKMSEMTKSKKKAKKEKPSRKYTQQDSNEEVLNKSESLKKPSKYLQIDVNETVVKTTQHKAIKSSYTMRHSKPEKGYIDKAMQCERKIRKATKYDIESEVACDSQHRHKVKHSEQRAQKAEQIESETESSASSSEQEIMQVDNSDSTEELYSSEQEEDSAEEICETYQKSLKQQKSDEYPHSHREILVGKAKRKRGKSSDLEQNKYISQSNPKGKPKHKKKAVDQSVSKASQHKTVDNAHGKCESVAQERKQKKSEKHSKKGVLKAPRENASESSEMRREEERVSSLYHRWKSTKHKSAKDTHQQEQTQRKKLDYQKIKEMAKKEVAKESVLVTKQQSLDEEIKEKPAPKSLRPKEAQTKSESEDEFSSPSTSGDQSELHLPESTRMKKHQKVQPNTDGNEFEKERAVKTKEETQGTKPKGLRSSDADMKEQSKEGKIRTIFNEKTKKVHEPKYFKADGTSPRKEERVNKTRKKVGDQDKSSSDSTQEDSEDEESDSDDSSEDEEDRDSEQKSSNEEKETEPDDESSPDTSEEEVTRKSAFSYKKERVKETGGRKGKQVKIAADVQDLLGDEDHSDPGDRDQEKHDIQPKKRSRRRHRESSMSPTTRGSSSSSTSQEKNQKQRRKGRQKRDSGRKKKKRVKKKNEERFSSTETDNSSPESEMLQSLSVAETKNLIKVFKSFFGRLCLAIKYPVEMAAQLQAKHLISRSTMESIITSPESQQVKAITLVRAMDKKVKQRPDKIFIITKLFLESEFLQKVGRQMLIETGNY